MAAAAPFSPQGEAVCRSETQQLAISDGEINFLWSFIQGSIMNPETRNALLRGFGFCERHAWVHLSVEMAFRKRHFLGPVILYRALIEKAVHTCQAQGLGSRRVVRQLRARGPCFLCTLNINHAFAGAASPARLDRGRDSSGLCVFSANLAPLWRPKVCAVCQGAARAVETPARCRPHLLATAKMKEPIDLSWQQATLQELSERLIRYERSFAAGAHEPHDRERAALIAAIGWCSGWRPLIALLHNNL
jgi:hypothetical protein